MAIGIDGVATSGDELLDAKSAPEAIAPVKPIAETTAETADDFHAERCVNRIATCIFPLGFHS